jgi:hypothetical protein
MYDEMLINNVLPPSVDVKTFHKKKPAPSDFFEKNPDMVNQYLTKGEVLTIYTKFKNRAERTGKSYRVELHEGRVHEVKEL